MRVDLHWAGGESEETWKDGLRVSGASAMRVDLHGEGNQRKLGRMVSEYLEGLALLNEATAA